MVRLGSPVRVRSAALVFVYLAFQGYFGVFKGMAKSKKTAVELISLRCVVCGHRNYTTRKNRRNTQEKLELKKYCKWCKAATTHKEGKIK